MAAVAEKETVPEQLADQAKALWDDDILMQEIANVLECNRDTVTTAIRHWFGSRGLPVPDGRNRRRGLDRKTSRRSDPEQPDGQQG
jgi:hypothetical protein